MSSRKEELLAKKARLAELKRQRELRQGQLSSGRISLGGETASPGKTAEERRSEIDNLVSSLIDRQRDSNGSPSRSRPTSFYGSSTISSQNGADNATTTTTTTVTKTSMLSVATQTITTDENDVYLTETPQPQPSVETPKKEYITYSKGVQTEPQIDAGVGPDSDIEQTPSPRRRKRLSKIERDRDEEIRERLRKEIEEELKAAQNGVSLNSDLSTSSQQRFPLRTLTDTELNAVTSSNDFQTFIERSSKVIERALDEEYDLLADYTRSSAVNDDDDDPYSGTSRKSQTLRESLQLYSEKHTRRRMVTDLHFSSHFNELLLTSYTKNPSAPNEPAGLVLLWNTHAPSRPEYTFTAGTDVLAARFSPFHPNLVIGGCYSGQICLWDTRASRNGQPVQRTPQSGSHFGHTHPVYNISIVGTPNAHNILTSSMDGVVCSWSFDMLTQAQEYLELSTPPPAKTDELAPTCMSFTSSDPTFFLVGTEEGSIYPCHRYDRAGAKAGVDTRLTYKGHTAPVMSTHFHPGRGPVDLGDLMLSSSSDWSLKLWRIKPAATSSSAAATAAATSTDQERISPILDLPAEDLVYDAKWSPHKPSVFAAVTGAGDLQVYDLNIDFEVPIVKASPTRGRNGVVPFKGLNKLAWEERRGATIATGGLDGIVTLFDVGKGLRGEAGEIGMEEWVNMKKLINKLDVNNGVGGIVNGQ